MVTRKYLILYFALLCIILNYNNIANASAWLPKLGQYQYHLTYGMIDKPSRKHRNERSDYFISLQERISGNNYLKAKIKNGASVQRRNLTAVEQSEIEAIKTENEDLTEEAKHLSSFSDDAMAFFDVEYGATESQSFGVKIGYTNDKFPKISSGSITKLKRKKVSEGKSLDVFYKYQVFKNDNWSIVLSPKIHHSKYSSTKAGHHFDVTLLVGYSKEKVKKKKKKKVKVKVKVKDDDDDEEEEEEESKYIAFQEFRISARKYMRHDASKNPGYVISTLDGIRFNDGVIFSNYIEYEKAKFDNYLYNKTLYEQISVAKEFYLDNLKQKTCTIQLGYFWKGSMNNQMYTISGPILSLWLKI